MDKKLLDKLNGFNLSMQQKIQLVELIQEAGGNKNNADSDEEYPIYVELTPTNSFACTLHVCLKECLNELIDSTRPLAPEDDSLNDFLETIKLNNYYFPITFERAYETGKTFISKELKVVELWYIYTHLLKNKTDLKITYALIRKTDNPLVFEYYPSDVFSIWRLNQCQYSVGGDIITAPDVVEKIPLFCYAKWSIGYNLGETLELIAQV